MENVLTLLDLIARASSPIHPLRAPVAVLTCAMEHGDEQKVFEGIMELSRRGLVSVEWAETNGSIEAVSITALGRAIYQYGKVGVSIGSTADLPTINGPRATARRLRPPPA